MYRKLSYFFLLFLILGCDNNLDLQPTDTLTPEQFLQNAENLDKAILGIYASAYYYTGELQTLTELLANEGELAYLGGGFRSEFDQKQVGTDNINNRNFWYDSYRAINLCNIVLENLALENDPVSRARLEGEAKFLRGLHYFELARFYALPFETLGPNNQPGVPLVLDGVTDLSQITFPARSTVKQVYDQTIADLQDAYKLLGVDNAPRADRYSALALLARVFLQQGNYTAARDAAHEVLDNSGHALVPDLAAAFNNESDSDEDIFAWQITAQDGNNIFNDYWATTPFGGASATALVAIEPPHFELYGGPDDRAGFFYAGNGTTVTRKWQGEVVNVPFIRVAEMRLIRAECNFRMGSNLGLTPETEINVLRARSNADPVMGITLQDILDERRRELSFEGHRFHDAKRLMEDIDEIPYNADRLVMPLPQSEIDVNPNLEQNPGYIN